MHRSVIKSQPPNFWKNQFVFWFKRDVLTEFAQWLYQQKLTWLVYLGFHDVIVTRLKKNKAKYLNYFDD